MSEPRKLILLVYIYRHSCIQKAYAYMYTTVMSCGAYLSISNGKRFPDINSKT